MGVSDVLRHPFQKEGRFGKKVLLPWKSSGPEKISQETKVSFFLRQDGAADVSNRSQTKRFSVPPRSEQK